MKRRRQLLMESQRHKELSNITRHTYSLLMSNDRMMFVPAMLSFIIIIAVAAGWVMGCVIYLIAALIEVLF